MEQDLGDLGHWQNFSGTLPTTNPYGFIYLIQARTTGRMYIGKKQMVFATCKKPLKGRQNKRRGTKESDWKTYTGSSKELNQDIETLGISNFDFSILKWCQNKWELSYYETVEIIARKALESNSYYNSWISCKIPKMPGLNKTANKPKPKKGKA